MKVILLQLRNLVCLFAQLFDIFWLSQDLITIAKGNLPVINNLRMRSNTNPFLKLIIFFYFLKETQKKKKIDHRGKLCLIRWVVIHLAHREHHQPRAHPLLMTVSLLLCFFVQICTWQKVLGTKVVRCFYLYITFNFELDSLENFSPKCIWETEFTTRWKIYVKP